MKIIAIVFSVVLLCTLLTGCIGKRSDPPICGGTTDRTDENAPKEIKSKDITRFSTQFYALDKYDSDRGGSYYITIEDNEKGEHVLNINGRYKHELVVEDQVFADLQKIIDEQGLVKLNGLYRVTAGLPPAYSPWGLSADYASGEKLSFTENGAPEAAWTSAFRDYFTKLLADAGFEDAMIPKEAITLKRFSFEYEEGSIWHRYGLIQIQEEDTKYFCHETIDREEPNKMHYQYAKISDELFAGLHEIIEAEDIEGFVNECLNSLNSQQQDDAEEDERSVEIYVEYQSTRRFSCDCEGAEIPTRWTELWTALTEYFEKYISENLVREGVLG